MTPDRDRANELRAELVDAVLSYGTACVRGATATTDHAAIGAETDAALAEVERITGQLRDLVTRPARRRGLPTFGEMRVNALRLLGDAQAELRSDWRDGTGPTRGQATAMRAAMTAIARAAAALDRAAQR